MADRASNRAITPVLYSNATTETNRNDVTHQVCLFIRFIIIVNATIVFIFFTEFKQI